MVDALVTRLLKDHLAKYLDGFDKVNISILSGVITLRNLVVSKSILDHLPVPLWLKHGRIGCIRIELPSVWQMTLGTNLRVHVTVSDVFLCLRYSTLFKACLREALDP